jgi:DNA helicase-2/ATP-dependent DNA helicase PcrA
MLEHLQRRATAGEGPAALLVDVLESTGYLAQLQASTDPQDEARVENLRELVAVCHEFELEAPEGTLADFLEQVSLVADSDQIPEGDDHGGVVTLMTLHTAKGLEFPVVFVTGLEDGVFPHQRSLGEPHALQEERRLAYVGLTRARQRLYLSRAMMRAAWGAPQHNPASRFLTEIPDSLVDWRRTEAESGDWRDLAAGGAGQQRVGWGPRPGAKARPARPVPVLSPGDRVTHDSFGVGRVVSTFGAGEQAQASIDFGDGRPRTLLLRYAPVEKL